MRRILLAYLIVFLGCILPGRAQNLEHPSTSNAPLSVTQAAPDSRGADPEIDPRGQDRSTNPRHDAIERLQQRLAGVSQEMLERYFLMPSAGNVAITLQAGESNELFVQQRGTRNIAVLQQIGAGNASTLTQIGNGNIYGSRLIGELNQLEVLQQGNDNIYLLDFVGSDLDHTVQQIGDNIQAVQIGIAQKPVSIMQRGNDMQVTVRHNGAQQ